MSERVPRRWVDMTELEDARVAHRAVAERLHGEYRRRAAEWSDIQGHLEFLHEEVSTRPGCRVVELGVRWGTSTSALLAGAAAGLGHLWSIDIEYPRVPGWWLECGVWSLHVGDDLAQEALAFAPSAIDVLFIDTSHAADQTLKELRAWGPRVVPGGVICCHDTDLEAPEGVGAQPPFPVRAGIEAWCAETGRTWQNRSGSYGMGVIRIPEEA